MITKAEVLSIDRASSRCIVNMPLFQNASDTSPVTAEALINITPGLFNNIFVGDIVFIGFEENRLENPVILGKLYRGAKFENETAGGAGIFDSIKVNKSATLSADMTQFTFNSEVSGIYTNLGTPRKMADNLIETKNELKALQTRFNTIEAELEAVWPYSESLKIDDGNIDVTD